MDWGTSKWSALFISKKHCSIFEKKIKTMKTILSTLLVSFLILGISCKEGERSADGPSQMERVLAVHDEVMPKMGQLGKLVGQLKEKVDSTSTGAQYERAMKDLQDAHTAMSDWMKNCGDRVDHGEILGNMELSAQKQEWLDQEEVKVGALRDQINGSIERAEALLAKEE